MARANAQRLGLDVAFRQGDLLAGAPGPFDAVVSNPPYVADGDELAPDIVRYEPALALRAGPDGLDVLRRLIPGVGAGEAGARGRSRSAPGRRAPSRGLLQDAGFADVRTIRDLAGVERVVVGRR